LSAVTAASCSIGPFSSLSSSRNLYAWPIAGEVGADRVQLLLLLELADALLQAVIGARERRRLALVARSAVGTGQLVETIEEWTRVTHIATDRGVRPLAGAVSMKTQMKLDQT
jgi:hypothetical protein